MPLKSRLPTDPNTWLLDDMAREDADPAVGGKLAKRATSVDKAAAAAGAAHTGLPAREPAASSAASAVVAVKHVNLSPSATNAVAAAQPAAQTAVSASSFVASIGINTAMGATWSSYGNLAAVEAALSYLGVTNVRDTFQTPNDVYTFQQLNSQLGIVFDFHLDASSNGIAWQISEITANPGLVKIVEGPNETDSSPTAYDGLTGLAATEAEQTALYDAVEGDVALNGNGRVTPVVQASFAQVASFSQTGNWSSISSDGNAHEYFADGNQPGSNIATYIAMAQEVSPAQPVIATEAGYATMPSVNGVDDLVQAKYDLTLLFDDDLAGIPMTYLFELFDEQADPAGSTLADHFGLFDSTGAAKPAATALHNLIALLNDPGSAPANASLSFAVSGLPAGGHDMLIAKSDGDFLVALWNDVDLWNPATASAVSVAPVPVTLTFGQTEQTIAIYDPLAGTAPIATYANTNQISVNVPDHPILVDISAKAIPQLSLSAQTLTETEQSGQVSSNLWATILANAQESNSAYASGVTIVAVSTTGTTGTVTFNAASQTLTYKAPAYNPFATTDSVTYTVSDGHGGTATGTLRLIIAPPPATTYGMAAGGVYVAPSSGWTLYSEAAGQTLIGSSQGQDTFLGLGDTTIAAYGTGNVVSALAGDHVIAPGAGQSTVTLGGGNNTIYGAGSGDTIVAGNGNSIVMGETGATSVTLGNGNQAIGLTGAGNTISIGVGTSVISAGSGGNETVTLAGGSNQISLGGSNDVVHIEGGTNVVGATGASARFQLDAGSNTIYAAGTGNTVTGGNGNTTLWGPTGQTSVTLGNGNNTIQLTGAGNTISLGNGTNIVDAGTGGGDTITIAGGSSQVTLGGANNVVTLQAGSNTVTATATASRFTAVSGTNTIYVQGTGNTITGGNLSDSVIALNGSNSLTSGSGTDQIRFAGSGNSVVVGKGSTTLYDSGSANTIRLAAAGTQETQIYGAVTSNGDMFDLRALLASTAWSGNTALLGEFLSFTSSGSDAILSVTPTGLAGGATYAVADLHASGPIALSAFLSNATV